MGFLSQAGREILIKTVAQAIPTYAMQCFQIPVSILNEIEKMCRNFFWGQRTEERRLAWVGWEKIYASKRMGGLGMRNLQVFNKAMLAKQAWRIMTRPESLVAQVLKKKYFPHTTFLKAKCSPMSSFTWRSICSARDLIACGARRRVGDGCTINIWNDPWITKLPSYKVLTKNDQEGEGPMMVRDLFEDGEWKTTLLQSIFTPWEVQAICDEPLPMFPCEDSWTWTHTKSGDFTVRSAYYIALQERNKGRATTSNVATAKHWQQLWGSSVPPKIRMFGWRVMHGGIPVRANLIKRGMDIDGRCPMCGEEDETVEHCLFLCSRASVIWEASVLRLQVGEMASSKFIDWIGAKAIIFKKQEWWETFWSIVWQIWLRRNEWYFNKKEVDANWLLAKAQGLIGEYRKANEDDGSGVVSGRMDATKWKTPGEGLYKANADAAIFEDGRIGVGGLVRDTYGDVLLSMSEQLPVSVDVDVAEAIALRSIVKVAWEAGIRSLVLETDCLKVYNALRKTSVDQSVFGLVVRDILQFSNMCNSLSFSFVRRSGNGAAHKLAHVCRRYPSLRVWIEEVPPEVLPLVISDASDA